MNRKKKTGLQKALASKIGRHCYFTNPETGKAIEGTYKRGRKVVQLIGIVPPKGNEPGGGRTYVFNEVTWTVPKHIKITFGQPPLNAAAAKAS